MGHALPIRSETNFGIFYIFSLFLKKINDKITNFQKYTTVVGNGGRGKKQRNRRLAHASAIGGSYCLCQHEIHI
jgi:hypothetical protein